MDNKEKVLKVFTAFSGYDSQCLALNRLSEENPEFKYDLVGWSEIDEYACKAHNVLFPQFKDRNYGDISKIDWKEVPDFDLFTYSSPCFIAGTCVLTLNGAKKIEDITEDDYVLTHTGTYKKVISTSVKDYSGDVYIITTNDNKVVCTPNHPFYVKNINTKEYKWIEAKDLNDNYLSTVVYDFKTDGMTPNFMNYDIFVNIEPAVYTKVYNLDVEEDESYIANNIVVHNCTDFSLAGRQAGGEEGSGTRSSLLWECRRCIEAKKPKYMLLENVTNLVSKKFYPLFMKWVETVSSLGYESFWKTLNAKDFGIPQNRDRVFLVSIRKDLDDEVIDYNFPNTVDRSSTMEEILEPRGSISEKYYINQDKVNGWIVDNEERISDYISERCGISRENIEIDKHLYNPVVQSKEDNEVSDNNEEDMKIVENDDRQLEFQFEESDMIDEVNTEDKTVECTEEVEKLKKKTTRKKKDTPKTTKVGHCIKRIATPVRSDGFAPTLMATGYATADYKNFYSMGHFPKLGIFEVWKKDKTDKKTETN